MLSVCQSGRVCSGAAALYLIELLGFFVVVALPGNHLARRSEYPAAQQTTTGRRLILALKMIYRKRRPLCLLQCLREVNNNSQVDSLALSLSLSLYLATTTIIGATYASFNLAGNGESLQSVCAICEQMDLARARWADSGEQQRTGESERNTYLVGRTRRAAQPPASPCGRDLQVVEAVFESGEFRHHHWRRSCEVVVGGSGRKKREREERFVSEWL